MFNDVKSLQDLEKQLLHISQCMRNSALVISTWIPAATDKDEAMVYLKILEKNISIINEGFIPWEEIILNAYKENKSVEAYNKLVELGILNPKM